MKGFFEERIEHIEMLKSTLNSAAFLGWSQSTQITGLPMQGPGDEMRDLVVLNVTTETVHMIHMVLYDGFDYFGYMSVDTYLHIYLYIRIYASLTLPSSQKCCKSISHKKSFAPLEV